LRTATLDQFASATANAARAVPQGDVVGSAVTGGKVFISDAFDVLQRRGQKITLPEFKSKLLRANQVGKISLSRSDLAYAFDQRTVARSSIDFGGTTRFHQIRL
jgi:hypothetical protein